MDYILIISLSWYYSPTSLFVKIVFHQMIILWVFVVFCSFFLSLLSIWFTGVFNQALFVIQFGWTLELFPVYLRQGLLCSWSGTQYIDQVDLELTDLPASWVLRLEMFVTMPTPSFKILIKNFWQYHTYIQWTLSTLNAYYLLIPSPYSRLSSF